MNIKKYFFLIFFACSLTSLSAQETWEYQHTLKQGKVFPIVEQEGQYLLFRKGYYFFYQHDTLVAKGGLGGRCGWMYMKNIERGFNETKGDTLIVSKGQDQEVYVKNNDFCPHDLIIFHNDFPQKIEGKYVFRTGFIQNLSDYPVCITAFFDKEKRHLSISPMVRKKWNAHEWGYPPESVYGDLGPFPGNYCLQPEETKRLNICNGMSFYQTGEYRHSLTLFLDDKRSTEGKSFVVHSNSIFIKK